MLTRETVSRKIEADHKHKHSVFRFIIGGAIVVMSMSAEWGFLGVGVGASMNKEKTSLTAFEMPWYQSVTTALHYHELACQSRLSVLKVLRLG